MLGLSSAPKTHHGTVPQATPAPDPNRWHPAPLDPGSATARAVLACWNGTRVVTVDAPPGSGKTRLVTDVLGHLVTRAEMRVAIGTPTRAQGASIARRLLNGGLPDSVRMMSKLVNIPADRQALSMNDADVVVATLASLGTSKIPSEAFDLLVVDEAYQAQFSHVSSAAAQIGQLLLVGDPGQIGPVVEVDMSAFDGMARAPHHRAQGEFARFPDAVNLTLPRSYRLGPETCRALSSVYPFTFDSGRPDRFCRLNRVELPEVTSVPVGTMASPDDPVALERVVRAAAAFVGSGELCDDAETRPVTGEDVAVVVVHNAQAAIIAARLSGMGIENVTVGTADKLQGGEWPVVVALDPAAGQDPTADFAANTGRLTTAASRHMTHLVWCYDTEWEARTQFWPADGNAVRRQLIATEQLSV